MLSVKNIVKFANNQKLAEFAQNTMCAVAVETSLKAIGRPTATLLDKNADKDQRKYSASREFIYQALCFGFYMLAIPQFKKYGFQAIKKLLEKENPIFAKFTNYDEFKDFQKLAKGLKENKTFEKLKEHLSINKNEEKLKFWEDEFESHKKAGTEMKANPIVKGAVELSAMVGSAVTLTMVAPWLVNYAVHPIMNLLGIKEVKKEAK